jgi:hypothetical protein
MLTLLGLEKLFFESSVHLPIEEGGKPFCQVHRQALVVVERAIICSTRVRICRLNRDSCSIAHLEKWGGELGLIRDLERLDSGEIRPKGT